MNVIVDMIFLGLKEDKKLKTGCGGTCDWFVDYYPYTRGISYKSIDSEKRALSNNKSLLGGITTNNNIYETQHGTTIGDKM